ncbi:MAG TPA: diguanylate cyclase [Spirochaetia bacterium]|nr:diguanylate cyclase [Spirochaetia bacterium]
MARQHKNGAADAVTRTAERLLAAAPAGALPAGEYAALLQHYRRLLAKFHKVMLISDTYDAELKRMSEQLDHLRSLALPICMFCKKVRVDDEYWEQIEGYFARHIDVAFSHGICPSCMKERYGDIVAVPDAREQLAGEIQARAEHREGPVPDDDDAVRAAQALLDTPEAGVGALRSGLHRLVERYRRMLRRMGKILLISDGYQARLMDLNARLTLLAHTDGLTGLDNRHSAAAHLEAERSRAERHSATFSVAIADVDDFKLVNDRHGHEAGDILLKDLGRLLRAEVRREDVCARWGGEEFLFLLPETDGPAAESLLQKLLAAARRLEVRYRGSILRCTLSAGVSTFRAGASVDDLLREADSGLYRAKAQGKDRLVVGP